uniref:modulator of macroautophagy TMEM150B-like n=1 Tax=Styela clava TaxID=7725 RepID=UPI001939980D|nr:modulator of macroautophagy TMEM150B-like [Styela clava]
MKHMAEKWCLNPSWHHLPIFLGVTAFFGMITTYTLAKNNCHVEKWFLPYISYTGTEHPESSIFGLILNTEGFIGIVVVILAWRFMRHMDQRSHLNSAALISGILSCFGVVMVGNFQVSKNKVPHYVGAGLAFIVGTVYCVLSSILTHKLHRAVARKSVCSIIVCILRFVSAGIMISSICILTVLGCLRLEFNVVHKNEDLKELIAPSLEPPVYRFPNGTCIPIIHDVPLYKRYLDLAGSVTEWLLTGCLLFSLALYAYEFKHFNNVKIILKSRGTELNFSLLQSKNQQTSQRTKYVFVSSPEASLLSHAHSDTTILHHVCETPSSRVSDEITFDCQGSYKNNNRKQCIKDTNIISHLCDTSKSLPNIASATEHPA